MKTQIKLMLMFLITTAATYFSNGFPDSQIQWICFGIMMTGTMITYAGKNFFKPSQSPVGMISYKDVFGGLIIVIGAGLSDYVATLITQTAFIWMDLFKFIGTVIIGYFAKTMFATPPVNSQPITN